MASHRTWIFQNAAYLEGADGKPIKYDAIETLRHSREEVSVSYLFAVDKPIFSPREPATFAQLGVSALANAGNLWLWQPQIRYEERLHLSERTGLTARPSLDDQVRAIGEKPRPPDPVPIEPPHFLHRERFSWEIAIGQLVEGDNRAAGSTNAKQVILAWHSMCAHGGPGWIRTIDLTVISRAL